MLVLIMLVVMTGCTRAFSLQSEITGRKVDRLALNRSLVAMGQSGSDCPMAITKITEAHQFRYLVLKK